MKRISAGGVVLLICCLATGCGPTRYVDGVSVVADEHGVRSADTLCVAHRGYLRFDHALLSDMDDLLQLEDADRIRTGGREMLTQAHTLAVQAVADEIQRMSPEALDELVHRFRLNAAPTQADARRTYLTELFKTRSAAMLQADLKHFSPGASAASMLDYLQRLRRDVEPGAGDRGKVARALIAAPLYLPAAIGAEIADAEATDRLTTTDFANVIRYEPPSTETPTDASKLEHAAPAQLAQWYAPVFVQQVNPDATYAGEDDEFGRVYLDRPRDNIDVRVDTKDPVVYWAHQQAKVDSRRYDQLVYVAWYPRRPAMEANDPSAGNIDGVVVRITLDRHHRPAVYEFVRSCGCYHTLWVAEFVEAAARREFEPLGDSKKYAIKRDDVQRSLFMPTLVRDDGSNPHRPIVFVNAGYHLVLSVHPLTDAPADAETKQQKMYKLEPYDMLTRLPLGDAVASMFGSDGLVHNAGRAEGWLLAPTGMLSAGQPRQLGTMKIRMDAYDYDDPRLLEKNLRLPQDF